jgi:hypothetical protein
MTGTKHKQKPTDEMCPNCGLYYSRRGIVPHRRNCDRDEPLLPLDRDDEAGGSPSKDGGAPEGADPSDGVGGAPDPEGSGATDEPARTDGAGLGLEGPPEATTDVDDDQEDDEPNTADCPACGEDLGVTEEDLAEMDSPRCAECGTGVSVS